MLLPNQKTNDKKQKRLFKKKHFLEKSVVKKQMIKNKKGFLRKSLTKKQIIKNKKKQKDNIKTQKKQKKQNPFLCQYSPCWPIVIITL